MCMYIHAFVCVQLHSTFGCALKSYTHACANTKMHRGRGTSAFVHEFFILISNQWWIITLPWLYNNFLSHRQLQLYWNLSMPLIGSTNLLSHVSCYKNYFVCLKLAEFFRQIITLHHNHHPVIEFSLQIFNNSCFSICTATVASSARICCDNSVVYLKELYRGNSAHCLLCSLFNNFCVLHVFIV